MIYGIYSSAGHKLGETIILRQAVQAAIASAPSFVEQVNTKTGEARRVQFNEDGSVVQLWRGGFVWGWLR